MAYDEQDGGPRRGRGRWPNEERGDDGWGRPTQWRGDQGFGGGWGNQTARPQSLGDRYRAAGPSDYDSDLTAGGPGFDAGFGAPRFDRADVSSASAYGGGFGRSAREYMIANDPHYAQWRDRQIADLDRDYDEYRRESQSRFDREFGAWREKRGAQRQAIGQVRDHMEVIGADGSHVGTVDKVRDERIVLTRSDPDAGGVHHSIPCGWIERVDDKVVLNIDGEEAKRRWQEDNRSRALFEREHKGVPGPHVLNRSFAGTYPGEE